MTSTTMTSSTRAACPSTKVACPSTSTTMTSSVRVGPPFAVPSTGEAQALSTIIASMVAACLVEAAVETIIGPWKRIKAEVLTLSLEATTIIKVVVAGRPPSVLGGGVHLHSQRLYRLDHRSGFHPIH